MRGREGRESLSFIDTCLRSLERDLERARADHISEMENMQEKHRQTISENKKKQWVSRDAVSVISILTSCCPVLPVRIRGDILVLLEHGLLQSGVSTGPLDQGTQETMQEAGQEE